MKKIFLIGDSIRFGAPNSPGYGVYVKEKLAGEAEVYAPNENCRFAQHTLRFLHEWAASAPKEEINVVHWNNGLWDALHLFGDEAFTELDYYGKTLVRIYHRIRLVFPNARVIFALSTSVKEDWANPAFIRYNHEIEEYNKKAVEVLAPLGVEFNDLYSISKTFDDSLRADWVHYGDEGSKILADAVIRKCFEEINE